MLIRNIDNDNDWTFGQLQSNYVSGQDAIVLDIKLKLQEWLDDCFFALQNGIPWNIRLGSKNQKELLDSDILRIVKSVEGVLNIYNFESMVLQRRYRTQFSIYTRYSDQFVNITFDTQQGVLAV